MAEGTDVSRLASEKRNIKHTGMEVMTEAEEQTDGESKHKHVILVFMASW